MYRSIYDLKGFYNGDPGTYVRKILRHHIENWWPDVKNQRVIGIGFAPPYLDMFMDTAERCFAVMPAGQGVFPWPENARNLTVLAEESELPLETNSVDRILLIHSLEYAELMRANLQELWRVLKSNGRLLVITPNRRGFWARADWSPFGQGTPYSLNQLRWFLRDNLFVYERHKPALFMPPIKGQLIYKSAETLEKICPYIIPALAGVHMVEASKQLYAGADTGTGSKVRVRGRVSFVPDPAPLSFEK
jgi:SAM-dependent methyltransferase